MVNSAKIESNFKINIFDTEDMDVVKTVNSLNWELECIEDNNTSTDILMDILTANLNTENYEEVFYLKQYHAIEAAPSEFDQVRNIKYKDKDGTTVAIVKINLKRNKIRVEAFGHVLPKQEFCTPKQVGKRVKQKAFIECWATEDGGINQFDGNIEVRYKNKNGQVMAALITKSDGYTVDTVVEYKYVNGKKSQMLHTNQYGQTMTIYDLTTEDASNFMRVDIDTDGCIYAITRGLN